LKNFLLLIWTVFVAGTGWAQAPVYTIATVAGNATSGYSGDGGPASEAQLTNPCKIATDKSGNLFIGDQGNARIREVSGGIINTVAGNGTNGYTGDGGAATAADISDPCGVLVDPSGNVYFSQTDFTNSAVRKAPASGNISTITGTSSGAGFSGDGGVATNAQVNAPTALARDNGGTLYIADSLNNRVRIIDSNGNISTKAGNGIAQYAGDGQLAWRASLNNPQGVALDAAGNLYIADTLNHCIRRVAGNIMSTFAGTCSVTGGFSGDGGPATKAQLNYPKDVAVDASGNVFIVDSYNFRIRLVKPDGTIWTIAGRSGPGYSGDGGFATSAHLSFATGIALGPSGTIFVSDTQNNVIRVLTPGTGTGTTTLPPIISGVVSASACGDYTSAAPGAWVEVHGSNLATDTRPWAASDFTGNNAPTALDGTKVSIGGQNAVISYISASQINAQVPLALAPGALNVTVTSPSGTSPAFGLNLSAAQPGLCQGVSISGNPYAAAVVNNTSTYVLPATAPISGISFRPAHPGETISFFGNGFGAVTPSPAQGQLVSGINQLTTPLLVFFGQTQATVTYAGNAPGYIGLYQINVVVPNIPDSDLVPVTFALGDFAGAPTLYTAVKQ
jgi:trimeric autotransporter adhesin